MSLHNVQKSRQVDRWKGHLNLCKICWLGETPVRLRHRCVFIAGKQATLPTFQTFQIVKFSYISNAYRWKTGNQSNIFILIISDLKFSTKKACGSHGLSAEVKRPWPTGPPTRIQGPRAFLSFMLPCDDWIQLKIQSPCRKYFWK